MAQLIVRNLAPAVVGRLKQRAATRGRSSEAEHRAILEAALGGTDTAVDFKAFLLSMPALTVLRLRRSQDRGRRVAL